MREHAETMFPRNNVSCVTAHSIAFRKCGFMYSKKLTANLKTMDIIDSDLLTERDFDKKSDRSSIQVCIANS